ncbi:chondroadherin-like protein [Triplophysa dalaica]|uniref:chondroadherin-like protein n=1 Tax=Triplophysa dalaica TaxID=1582913 RepID=UPI0024DFA0CF|nr:chondroadherin-like protein [Triplophysa dalaica]
MYLHLEGNSLSQFPSSEMLAHIPKLLELHLERNLMVKLEPVGLLNPIPQLTGLYLANNAITNIVPRALDSAPNLDVLHLGDNKLTEVPSDALGKAPLLTEVHWIGPRAFRGVVKGLKHLYIDRMGLQKMSAKSLAWFGPGLVSLSLEENQLEELPDLSSLTGLQHLTLGNNPLMWLSNASLKVEAVCGYPSELRGQYVIKADVFINCSGENNESFNKTSITTNEDKLNKPFHSPTKARPAETYPKPAETKMTAGLLQNSGLKPDKKLKTRRLKKKNRRKKTKH